MIRLALAALSRPLRWRSRRATARMLLAFARAERSSHFDMMEAANRTLDPARQALYLRHAVDEARHGEMFTLRALELWPALAAEEALHRADFEHLFSRLGESRFIAFVHHGERRGRAQMLRYRDELKALEGTPRADPKTRALLDAVLVDEARHEAYSAELMAVLGTTALPARAWELWRSWRRAGAALTGLLFTAAMSALYLLLFPLALAERLRRR